ncbi:hemerythrin domain-containing protein [Saccharolobus shibatae]|uniref:Hemerythrin-like domain-containing protein n=1 Tax=Saccharolobus shibatae TaxID=2286 RepID=A0A8F5C178_9CREN|nr:hemerythrin domain-containing protein [Saccharolobus shibatae]QXJ32220.1 hypothetical protein J5U21_01871 [Saccharolobus shibatae]QXJ35244.1 hypothetical protein J5U22_01791 [Saccharolobus shibatae]
MTGPSLRQKDSHSLIHRAIVSEIEEATVIVEKLIGSEQIEGLKLLLEIWKEKVVRHADEEERGLFPEILTANPSMSEKLEKLSSQHEQLRSLLKNAESIVLKLTLEPKDSSFSYRLTQYINEGLDVNKKMISILKQHFEDEENTLWEYQ